MKKISLIAVICLSLNSCINPFGEDVVQYTKYQNDTTYLITEAWSYGTIVYRNESILDSTLVDYYYKKASYALKVNNKRIR